MALCLSSLAFTTRTNLAVCFVNALANLVNGYIHRVHFQQARHLVAQLDEQEEVH